jgi:hypothetical protein
MRRVRKSHLTLKTEATKPAAPNVLQQQPGSMRSSSAITMPGRIRL